MKIRSLLAVLFAATLTAAAVSDQKTDAAELGIGSKAPALDIEHWLQDGNGFFKPVTEFKEGNVYVVEFWATWCGPCIGSMPHLAELQQQYRGQGVQIVSVSDETVEEVKDLLGRDNPQVGKTFDEITAAYSLTTDPDRSVHIDYMEAANQQGIPTAFIVGKSGLVEWIGHPGNMDEPLEKVVTDSWDREAYKAEMKLQEELQENMQTMAMLAGQGNFDKAMALVESQIKNAPNEMLTEHWTAIRYSLKLSMGELDDATLAFYREQIAAMKGDTESLVRFGYSLYGITQQGAEIGPLAKDAIKAIEAEADNVEDAAKPMYFNTIALLNDAAGDLKAAIKAQEAAIEAADDRTKRRLIPMLEELKERAAEK